MPIFILFSYSQGLQWVQPQIHWIQSWYKRETNYVKYVHNLEPLKKKKKEKKLKVGPSVIQRLACEYVRTM